MQAYKRNGIEKNGLPVRIVEEKNTITVSTIGHSNRTIQQFLDKLKDNRIQLVIDVRSHPLSRWCPHFCRRNLELALRDQNIEYLFKGNNLGGLEQNIDYNSTIEEVVELAASTRLVLLCAEADPTKCHRQTILTPDIEKHGIVVSHIIWDKSSQKPIKSTSKQSFLE